MLVLNRKNGMWTSVKVSRENLQKLLQSNQEPELRFRVYNIDTGKVNIAFEDPDRNFEIQRCERTTKTTNEFTSN